MDKQTKNNKLCSSKNFLKKRIGISTGDIRGVGSFVASKSLQALGPQSYFQFLIWTNKQAPVLRIPGFKTQTFTSSSLALKACFNSKILLQIQSSKPVGDWIEELALLCLNSKISGMLTGPVSKKTIKNNKHKALSQTSLLSKLSNKKNVFMCFRGGLFNVVLFTDHIPLKKVSINIKKLKACLNLSLEARKFLKPALRNKPLGLLALNPHASENGLIGSEETKQLGPVLKSFSSKEVQGPLCPDSAFLKSQWNRYSFFIALYHDQGLIPFKLAHEHKGFSQTLGLPFLRFSVDHGLGLNVVKNKISYSSFLQSLKELLKVLS